VFSFHSTDAFLNGYFDVETYARTHVLSDFIVRETTRLADDRYSLAGVRKSELKTTRAKPVDSVRRKRRLFVFVLAENGFHNDAIHRPPRCSQNVTFY